MSGHDARFILRQCFLNSYHERTPWDIMEYTSHGTIVEDLNGVGKTQIVFEVDFRHWKSKTVLLLNHLCDGVLFGMEGYSF